MPRLSGWRPALITLCAASIAGMGLLAGCNLLSPMAADSGADLTYQGLLLKGTQAINDGDYAAAVVWFDRAMKLDYRGSEAYLFHSKALVSLYKIDYNRLNQEFKDHRDGIEKGIPFLDSATTVESIDSLYYPIAQSVENLEHILRHAKDTVSITDRWKLLPDGDTAGDGRISEGVARLDLGLLETMKGMLGPLDLDGDNHVSRDCGRNVCPDAGDAACRASAAYRRKCSEGPASELNRLERFKLLTRNIDIKNLDTKDVQAKEVSSNPNDINDFLDKMQGPISASSFNLDSVTGSMNAHNEDKLSGQLNNIVTDVSDLNDFLSYMRYNDGRDNDFDTQDTASAKPMVWHDYNKDGGILYDYDDTLTFQGFGTGLRLPNGAPSGNGGAGNIGHPLHRYVYPELYVKFTDPEWTRRAAATDSSGNSRKSIMIKHCINVVSDLLPGGKVTDDLKLTLQTKTCSTYTSILKPGVKPPARSDWLGGTYGIDEEMFDNRDNEYDGLKDEDARNAKGMDDDDDGNLTTAMIGTSPAPMVWRDVPGHANACPDMDTLRAMPPPPFQRKFCIGSLENRIYLAQHYGRDSLKAYYSKFRDDAEAGNANCLEDAAKLPAEYKAAALLESGSQRQYDIDVDLACQYKHIWLGNVPPPNSEWTSGVFGVDEEIPDGVDNDGDGWIDEDVR